MFSRDTTVLVSDPPSNIRLIDSVGKVIHIDDTGFYIVRLSCYQRAWDFSWEEVKEVRLPERCLRALHSDYFDFIPCGHCSACLQNRDCLRPEPKTP